MTAQISDSLSIEHPSIDLEDLLLYRIITSQPEENGRSSRYKPKIIPKEIDPFGPHAISCNWKGYQPDYTLTENGELILNYYHYVTTEREYVNETYIGEFWMVMRKDFFCKHEVFIPFQNGKVVINKNEWIRLEIKPSRAKVGTLEA